MDVKYLKPDQFEMKKSVCKRIGVNIFKIIYYTSASILGYYTLVESEYFPTEIGGKNSIWSMLDKEYRIHFSSISLSCLC